MTDQDNSLLQDSDIDKSQYLTFKLASEEYAVEILRTQEIRSWEQPTKIPNTPPFVLGLINLRGTVVPIIDLRKRFNLENIVYDDSTVVVVAKIKHQKGERTMGLVVDAVSDVHDIEQDRIKPAPEFGGVVASEYIKGLVNINNRLIIILDLELLINKGILATDDNNSIQ